MSEILKTHAGVLPLLEATSGLYSLWQDIVGPLREFLDSEGHRFSFGNLIPGTLFTLTDIERQFVYLIGSLGRLDQIDGSTLLPPTPISNGAARLHELEAVLKNLEAVSKRRRYGYAWGGWPEAIVIPTGCDTWDGTSDVDPDHPAAA